MKLTIKLTNSWEMLKLETFSFCIEHANLYDLYQYTVFGMLPTLKWKVKIINAPPVA